MATWVKGQSGNPGGRLKATGPSVSELLRRHPASQKRQLVALLWKEALAGNLSAAMYIINRMDGLPVAQVADVTSEEQMQVLREIAEAQRGSRRLRVVPSETEEEG